MPEDDDFATELRGEDEGPMNAKGNDWFATIVGGLIVGVVVSISNIWLARGADDSGTLVEVKTKVEYLAAQVNKLTEQPYARREDLNRIENRVTGLERQVDQLEQRTSSDGRRRQD